MPNALRLQAGVPLERFGAATGLPLASIQTTVDALIAEGLLADSPNQLRATALGQRFLDSVVGRFFPD